MADFEIAFKTNDFYVTDEHRYQRIMDGVCCEGFEKEFYEEPSKELAHLLKYGLKCYDKNGKQIPPEELDNHSIIYKKNINDELSEYYQWKDESGRKKHAFGGFGSMTYYMLASQNSELCLNIKDNIKMFDADGNAVDTNNIDDYDKIYDEHGDVLWDRFDVNNIDENDLLYDALTSVIAPDSAIAITIIGHEKLRQMFGETIIIAKNIVEYHNLDEIIDNTIKRINDK